MAVMLSVNFMVIDVIYHYHLICIAVELVPAQVDCTCKAVSRDNVFNFVLSNLDEGLPYICNGMKIQSLF